MDVNAIAWQKADVRVIDEICPADSECLLIVRSVLNSSEQREEQAYSTACLGCNPKLIDANEAAAAVVSADRRDLTTVRKER